MIINFDAWTVMGIISASTSFVLWMLLEVHDKWQL